MTFSLFASIDHFRAQIESIKQNSNLEILRQRSIMDCLSCQLCKLAEWDFKLGGMFFFDIQPRAKKITPTSCLPANVCSLYIEAVIIARKFNTDLIVLSVLNFYLQLLITTDVKVKREYSESALPLFDDGCLTHQKFFCMNLTALVKIVIPSPSALPFERDQWGC